MAGKPLKIVRKSVEARPVTVKPQPVVLPKVGVKKIPAPSVKAQKVIADMLQGKPVSTAMRDNGYSDAYSKNPQQFKESNGVAALIDPLVKSLMMHRDDVLARMRQMLDEKSPDIGYSQLVSSFDILTKNIQLLTGRATGRIGFAVTEEERKMIEDIIHLNAE